MLSYQQHETGGADGQTGTKLETYKAFFSTPKNQICAIPKARRHLCA